MIRSTKMFYGIEAAVDIAVHGQAGALVRSVEISERAGIPRRYLEPVLQEFVRQDIITSVRGPNGGYRLARPAANITIWAVVDAIRCLETPVEDPAKSVLGQKVIRPLLSEVETRTNAYLNTITLADCVETANG